MNNLHNSARRPALNSYDTENLYTPNSVAMLQQVAHLGVPEEDDWRWNRLFMRRMRTETD